MAGREKVALITGAATGIGLATAEAFARADYKVVLSDRDEDRGEAAAEKLRQKDYDAIFVTCDVTDPDAVARLHREAMYFHGRVDVACNNAGIEGEQAPTADTSLENFDRVMSINLRGTFLCMREQLRIMENQRRGAIVNMASVAGLVGFAGLPAYCASKGALVQLTKTAALEYATAGIRINAVCPGAIKTEMINRVTGEQADREAQIRELHPMARFGRSDEIADAVIWLCSDKAGFITGHALPVDGGFVAR